MARKKVEVSLRRPPHGPAALPKSLRVPDDVAARFLAGGKAVNWQEPPPSATAAPEQPRAAMSSHGQPRAAGLITRQGGRQLRRAMVYLALDVDEQLRAHCRAHGCEASHAVNEALRAYLRRGA